jgi:thiol-disulfide isomerase/thioredoxin
MQIKIFGKKTCSACKAAREKFEFFLNRWKVSGKAKIIFYDLDTVEGLAEGSYYNVSEIPTTILEKESREITRWIKEVPLSQEFKKYF